METLLGEIADIIYRNQLEELSDAAAVAAIRDALCKFDVSFVKKT